MPFKRLFSASLRTAREQEKKKRTDDTVLSSDGWVLLKWLDPAMLCRWIERCIITIWLCLKLETRRWWRPWFHRSICVLVTVHNTMKAHHINISKHKHHIFAQEGGKPWIPQSCLVTPVANPKVSIWRGRVGRGTQKHTHARAHKLAAWAASFERLHIHRVSPVLCLTWHAPSQTFGHYIIALK